jgi:hypothetical protein
MITIVKASFMFVVGVSSVFAAEPSVAAELPKQTDPANRTVAPEARLISVGV